MPGEWLRRALYARQTRALRKLQPYRGILGLAAQGMRGWQRRGPVVAAGKIPTL